ncbi:AAA family ATPase [Corynebacterium sp. H78]|uniref:AAA family ATPase n=1 Tax=Corynebacterium sp. H78 TaxID=3133417 RepID=UPI0030A4AF7B
MKLHSIKLSSVRGIEQLHLADLPDTGVIVISGENEAGKSTIADAVYAALKFPSRSQAREVKSLRPALNDKLPVVELDMTLGDSRFVVRKVFAGGTKSSETTIRVISPAPQNFTGHDAESWLKNLLETEGTQHLWDVFVAKQGQAQTVLSMGAHAPITNALQEASGGRIETKSEQTTIEAVHAEYLKYYSAKGREATALTKPKAALEEAKQRVEDATVAAAAINDKVQEAAEIDERQGDFAEKLPEAEREVEHWQAAVDELKEFIQVEETAKNHFKLANSSAEAAKSAHEQRVSLKDQVAAAEKEAQEAQQEVEQLTEEVSAEQRHIDEATAAVESAKTASDRATLIRRILQCEVKRFETTASIHDLVTSLARVHKLDDVVRQAHTRLAALTVTEEDITRVRQAHTVWQSAVGILETNSPQVALTATSPTTVRIDGVPQDVTGEVLEKAVSTDTEIVVGDVTLTVSPGMSLSDAQSGVEDARATLDRLLSELGATDLNDAEDKAKERREAVVAQKSAEDVLNGELRGQSVEDMKARKAELDGQLARLNADRKFLAEQWAELCPDEPEPDSTGTLHDVRAAADESEEIEAEAVAKFQEANATARGVSTRPKLTKQHIAVAQAQAKADTAKQLAEQLTEAREKASDSDVTGEYLQAKSAAEAAAQALAEAEKKRKDLDTDDAAMSLEGARQNLKNLKADQSRDAQRRFVITGELNAAAGTFEELDAAEGELQRAQRAYDAVTRRARAAKLLYETLLSARRDTREKISEPLTNKLKEYGRDLFGHDVSYELTDDLAIQSRTTPHGTFEFSELSGGAKEQIDILLRLAAAGLMDGNAGAPVIIDDSLGYSDPARLRKMNNALARAGHDSQVIVLTCFPERFSRVSGSHQVNMNEITMG